MIKKVLWSVFITVAVLGLCGGYFYHVNILKHFKENEFVCKTVNISVRDSATNKIITSSRILDLLGNEWIGKPLNTINLNEIEMRLNDKGEILSSEAFTTLESLEIEVIPRRAAIRFINDEGHQFYCDTSGYVFPFESSVNAPLITGNIPLGFSRNFKGYFSDPKERKWIREVIDLTEYIEKDSYWKKLTSHLYVNEKGDIELYPTEGKIHFIWGKAEDTEEKFEKVSLWYKAIAPLEKSSEYTEVDLRFDNQIICR